MLFRNLEEESGRNAGPRKPRGQQLRLGRRGATLPGPPRFQAKPRTYFCVCRVVIVVYCCCLYVLFVVVCLFSPDLVNWPQPTGSAGESPERPAPSCSFGGFRRMPGPP